MANATAGFLATRAGGSGGGAPFRTDNGVSGAPVNKVSDNSGIVYAGTFSGLYKIEGTTTLNGDPVGGRLVLVTPHKVAVFVAGVYTKADGLFSFDGLAAGKYTIFGIDPDGTTNGVIWDYVDAVPR